MGSLDLDRFARASADPRRLAEQREALIDQLAWLADEAEALGPLLAGLPDWAVSETALPGERSVKGALARIAALDRGQRARWINAFSAAEAEDQGRLEPVADPDDAASQTVPALLDDLREGRVRLVEIVRAVPQEAWSAAISFAGEPVTLHDVLMSIVRDDADELRALAYRLHDAGLARS